MSAKKIVTTYAKSLFQNLDTLSEPIRASLKASKGYYPTVHIIGEELLLIRAVSFSSKTVKEFFTNPTYPETLKLDVLTCIFPGLTGPMKAFLKVLTERSHLSLIPEICDEYHNILLKFENCTKVKIITASSLEESSGSILLNSLKTLTGAKNVILTMSYNPKLLGGLIVEYGSSSVDASILKEFGLFFDEV